MSSACSQALGLPEIVAAVMEQLWSRETAFGALEPLIAALQVNRLWAEEATTVLWREDLFVRNLVHINDDQRRQYYANKISSLQCKFVLDELVNLRLQSLRFPRLTKVTVHGEYREEQVVLEEEIQTLLPYLQPQLHSLNFRMVPVSNAVFMQVQIRCPALRSLQLKPIINVKPFACDLLRFLNGMPSLTGINLGLGLQELMSDEIWIHLASRSNLQVLNMNMASLKEDQTLKISATVARPFPELILLNFVSEGKALHHLAQHLPSLKILGLDIFRADKDLLVAISACINLEEIQISFYGKRQILASEQVHLPAEGLLSIAKNCPRLYRIQLKEKHLAVDGHGITDETIKQVATYLPAMTDLDLDVDTNLSTIALVYLGDLCPKLRNCALRGDFDIEKLRRPDSAPFFACLESLLLNKITKNISLKRAASMISEQSPQLTQWEEFGPYTRFRVPYT